MRPASQHVDKVELNTAEAEVLAEELGLGPERARRIVAARPLRSWDELERIEGFTAQVVSALRASGAQLGEPSRAQIKSETDEERERRELEQTAGVDIDEGVLSDRRKGAGPDRRLS
jgi:hypothetical protein